MNKELLTELELQKSFLSKMPKQFIGDSIPMPAMYFENMEERFFHRIKENKPRANSSSLWDRYKVSSSIAAILCFAILGFGIFSIWKNQDDIKLSQNELQSYFASEEELEEVKLCDAACSQSHKHILDKISNEDIKIYFLETEGIDISKI